jgi:pimeloyl-ACP methyl ester carboxylesterase
MILATPMTSLALAAKACLDYRCEYYLPEVDVPVVLLLGDLDKLTSLEANERTASLLPDSRMKVYAGAGHCSLLERREEFNDDLADFLDEVFAS